MRLAISALQCDVPKARPYAKAIFDIDELN